MKRNRGLTFFIVFLLAFSLMTGTAYAAGSDTAGITYTDVPSTHWGYAAIMDMTSRGMFEGTSLSADGTATFSPDSVMTRAQFVTVITRYLYGDELSGMAAGETWYSNNYFLALKHGLLTGEELDGGDLTLACSRQEMSMLLIRAAYDGAGETAGLLIPVSNIPDYGRVDSYYRTYVLQAYSMGFLAGVDDDGTFDPDGHLTRAQAATAIYRLLDPSARVEVDFTESTTFQWPDRITYTGEVKDGEANGYGKMTFPGVGSYVGYYVNGKREGLGTFTWLVGDTYVGYWNKDKMTGSGTYTFSDGYVIRGIWQNNQIAANALYMSPSALVTTIGVTERIVARVEPEKITDAISWTSSSNIISIFGNGNLCTITAHAAGKATVTARTASGKVTVCEVVVNQPTALLRQIQMNYGDYTAAVGSSFQLKAAIFPENAVNGKITWSSSDTNVASVSTAGMVTAKSSGSAIISAKAESGLIATCYVVVEDPFTSMWSASWNVYSAAASGRKSGTYALGSCEISTSNMTARLSMSPYTGKLIDLNPISDYALSGLFETVDYAYELTFTSISDTQIITEIRKISDSAYFSDTVTTAYYILERQ